MHDVLSMPELTLLRYGNARDTATDIQQLYAFAAKMREELSDWLAQLPECLSVDMTYSGQVLLPHVLQLQ